jgi:arylsulfatase A
MIQLMINRICGTTVFFTAAVLCLAFVSLSVSASESADDAELTNDVSPPNFIVIFCDDLGYGDIGCFGNEKIRTPRIDRMAEEGMRLTSFYSSCSVCSPSRSSLMTGCYPRRVNLHCNSGGLCVLFPADRKGLNPEETTIAEYLKREGYATQCIGKWHLGDQPEFLPTEQGFDAYYGIPYSNDMGRNNIPLPLMNNDQVIEAPVDQTTLTKRYTEEAVRFIEEQKDGPFFLYMPHTFPHVPLFASPDFAGRSDYGKYGDAVEEIDWSTGEILDALVRCGIDENTLVLFTSDNGATRGGSNGPLRGNKGQTYEGGMRVPCIARWPDHVPANTVCDEISGTIDILPTLVHLAGGPDPTDRPIDGCDIGSLLSGDSDAETPHRSYYYYQMDQLQAIRSGSWKLYVALDDKKRNWGASLGPVPVELYNLDEDIGETTDVVADHPDVVLRLLSIAEEARAELGDMEQEGVGQRPAAWVEEATGRLLE